jgi:hypothetical protein
MKDINGKRFIIDAWNEKTEVKIVLGKYSHPSAVRQYLMDGNATSIQLVTVSDHPEPFATLTCYIPGVELADDEVMIKTWSENKLVAKTALASGLFEDTGKRIPTGFVLAEIWRVK